MSRFEPNEAFARKLDDEDPLAGFRVRFFIPEGMTYMDGNSLGLMAKDAETSVLRVMEEWKTKAIGGWLTAEPEWFYMAEKLGARAAPLVGAHSNEVVCTGTTTVNLHALLSTFYSPRSGRTKILADELTFPSDIYALKGQVKMKGLSVDEHLVLVPSRDGRTLDEEDIVAAMTDEISTALLPSVLYRSSQLLDIPYLTKKAHEKGIIIGFDCCHSAGAAPHFFDDWGVDFAFWCGYKYMNGGPGSPAFLYVNEKHFDKEPLLAGWFGYVKERQFDMSLEFQHARHAGGWQVSTPTVLGMAAVEGALKVMMEAGIQPIREKSLRLTEYFIYLTDHFLPKETYGVTMGTPREQDRRSGHVALERPEDMWRIYLALKTKGVVPDFRAPNVIRFAPVALYNTFQDVYQTVHWLKEIIDNKEYEAFSKDRKAVT